MALDGVVTGVGGQADFPTDPNEFQLDDRISWSKLDGKWLLETEQGSEFEWDTALRRWVSMVSHDTARAHLTSPWAETLCFYVQRTSPF